MSRKILGDQTNKQMGKLELRAQTNRRQPSSQVKESIAKQVTFDSESPKVQLISPRGKQTPLANYRQQRLLERKKRDSTSTLAAGKRLQVYHDDEPVQSAQAKMTAFRPKKRPHKDQNTGKENSIFKWLDLFADSQRASTKPSDFNSTGASIKPQPDGFKETTAHMDPDPRVDDEDEDDPIMCCTASAIVPDIKAVPDKKTTGAERCILLE